MKITKKELKQIIREEAVKFKRKLELEKELASIQLQLDEVHAGGNLDSGKNDGVHSGQKKAEFDTKSNNGGFAALVEEEEVTEDLDEAVDIAEIFAEMEEVNEEVIAEEDGDADDDEDVDENIAENLEEPMEGSSVAQKADADTVNDNMDKVKELNESEEIEAQVLTEEQMRMQKLAGIKKLL